MKPLRQKIFVFFTLLCFQAFYFSKAGAVHFSWSGSGRLETFFKDEKNYYAHFFFAFNPKLHINDSLSFQTRIDILGLEKGSPWKNLLGNSGLFHQNGYVFLYQDSTGSSKSSFPFIQPSQFYLDYKAEFFKVRIGRAPYHFGLGTSYLATNSPFDLWMSVLDQVSVFMIYENFYLQPSLFYKTATDKNIASALLQGGIEQDNWKAVLLYEYKMDKDSRSFAEAYGEYEEKNWSIKSSLSYLFRSENSFALALEALYNVSKFKTPISLELKAGALNKEAQLHPQYNLSLFLQNRWVMRKGLSIEDKSHQMNFAQIQNSVYFSPSFSVSFFEESLKLQPRVLLLHSFKKKQSRYDLDASGTYKIKENLFFNIQAGVTYQKKWNLGLLAQAAVSF